MSSTPGHIFEKQIVDGFRRAYEMSWCHKNPQVNMGDKAQMVKVKSPPDIIVVAPGFNLLIEAKATKQPSIRFDRVREHQIEHLRAFDDTRPDSFGLVAVLRYNGKKGKERIYESWLIPVGEWLSLEASLDRKSLPLGGVIAHTYLYPYRMPWVPGVGIDVVPAVNSLLRPTPSVSLDLQLEGVTR